MDALNRIRRRFVWVLLLTIVGLSAGMAYSYGKSGGYDATARLFVGTSAQDAVEAAQGHQAGQERVKTYAVLAEGTDLLERAADRSGTGVTGADLRKRLTVVALPGTVLLEVGVRGGDPKTAASEADAVATEVTDIVKRIEAPLNGGEPALGLITIQTAQSGVVVVGKFDYMIIAIAGVLGLALGLIFTGALPERRPPRRRDSHRANSTGKLDDDMREPDFVSSTNGDGPRETGTRSASWVSRG